MSCLLETGRTSWDPRRRPPAAEGHAAAVATGSGRQAAWELIIGCCASGRALVHPWLCTTCKSNVPTCRVECVKAFQLALQLTAHHQARRRRYCRATGRGVALNVSPSRRPISTVRSPAITDDGRQMARDGEGQLTRIAHYKMRIFIVENLFKVRFKSYIAFNPQPSRAASWAAVHERYRTVP